MGRNNKNTVRVRNWREKKKHNIDVNSDGVKDIDDDIGTSTYTKKKENNSHNLRTKALTKVLERQKAIIYMRERRKIVEIKKKEKNKDKTYKQQRRENEEVRDTKRKNDRIHKQQLRENEEAREIEKDKDRTYKKQRNENEDFREIKRENDRIHKQQLRENEEAREIEKDKDRTYKQQRRENEEVKEIKRKNDRIHKQQLRENKEAREIEKDKDRTYKQQRRINEEVREIKRKNDRIHKQQLRENEEAREIEKNKNRENTQQRRENNVVREQKRLNDKVYKRKKRDDEDFRELERNLDRNTKKARRENEEFRRAENQKEALRKKRERLEELYLFREKLLRNTQENKCIHSFLLSKTKGPDNICCCCENLFFEHSMVMFDLQKLREKLEKNKEFDFQQFLSKICNYPSNLICKTCLLHAKKGVVPKMAISNGLKFPQIPPEIAALNPLEERMCAPILPFMQIRPLLPFSLNPQLSLKGSVVNIRVEIDTMTKVLPRKFNDMSTIQIKLKRHIEHQSHYMHETIRPAIICKALKILVATPLYSDYDVTFDPTVFEAYHNNENVEIDFIVEDCDENTNTIGQDLSCAETTNLEIDEHNLYDDCFEKDDEVMLMDRNHQGAQQGELAIIAPGQGKIPVSWHEIRHIDEISFPKIFGGFAIDIDRKLTYTQRIKSEVRRRDRRSCNTTRLFYMAKKKLELSVISNVNVCLRKVKNNSTTINAAMVTSDSFISDAIRVDDGFRCLKQVRSSPAFWESKKKNLLAMIRQIGFPTFFLTLSASEIKWPELLVILQKLADNKVITLKEAMLLDPNEKTLLIKNDPVTCVRYIEHIFHQISRILQHIDGPFGTHHVLDFFERREFQARGSVHTHNLIYCKDAPVYDADRPESEEECVEFIDKMITCAYDPQNPNMTFQRHKHTQTCYKGRKKKKTCRFNYPIPPMPRTMILKPMTVISETNKNNWTKIKDLITEYFSSNIDVPFDTILLNLKFTFEEYILAIRSTIKRPQIFLRRSSLEVGINAYNTMILNILSSNMDIQFVLDPYSCASYMLNYVTKVDAGLSKLLYEAATDIQDGNTSIRQRLRKVGNVFINSNVMGAQEAVYHVLGLPLISCSRASVYINTFPSKDRTRMLKSKAELELLDVDSEDIFRPNMLDKYAKRPTSLDNICLADYAAKYEKSTKSEVENNEDSESIVSRKKEKIIKYRRFKHAQNPMEYYREQLLLFSPWRNELDEIENVDRERKYNSLNHVIEENRKRYSIVGDEVLDQALEDAFNEEAAVEEMDNQDHISKTQEVDLFPNQTHANKNKDRGKFSIIIPQVFKDDELMNKLRSLNKEQRQIVMYVLRCFKTDQSQLRIYLSGSAGVGKSMVISCIFNLINKYFSEKVGPKTDGIKVLLTAPSGKAAFNIGGMTLHSAFSLPVTQNGGQMPELSADIANTIRAQLQDLRLLIIDEISMVGGRLFQRVDTRLRQIMGKNSSFGGVAVIVVGDLNQLPPVLDTPIYLSRGLSDLSTLADNLLWEEFKCFELVQIMRQRNDADFITALNNLAVGNMSSSDVDLIKSREVDDKEVPSEAIRLFSLNSSVEQFNYNKIREHPGQLFICPAKDHISGNVSESKKSKIQETLLTKKTSETGGLPFEVPFKIGIKYMITSNIDISDGLVNGACGTLVHVSIKEGSDEVDIAWIDFNSDTVGKKSRSSHGLHDDLRPTSTPIKRICVPVTISKNMDCQIIREQIPLVPAEAITIHKSQGQTYSHVCVDIRDKSVLSRRRSLQYVALSRVTSLQNLYILGTFVPPKKAKVGDCLTVELERLKNEKRLELSYEHNNISSSSHTIIYQNVRSLQKHIDHILSDEWYTKGDLIVFSETRTLSSDTLMFHNFKVLYRSDCKMNVRSARGIVCFVRVEESAVVLHNMQFNSDKQHVDLVVMKIKCIYVITGYRAPSTQSAVFFSMLDECLTYTDSSKQIVLIGDFNWNTITPKSNFAMTLESKYNMERALPEGISTTDFNTQIDTVFKKNINSCDANSYESYFSDHKPVFIRVHSDNTTIINHSDQVVLQSNSVPNSSLADQSASSADLSSGMTFRGLENPNIACYSNAVTQLMYACESLRELIRSSDEVQLHMRAHLEEYESAPITTPIDTLIIRTMASEINASYLESEQQDSAEFLMHILNMNQGLSNKFSFTTCTSISCAGCGYASQVNDESKMMTLPVNSSICTLQTYVENVKINHPWETLNDYICPTCSVQGLCERREEILQLNRFLLIQFLLFNNASEKLTTPGINAIPTARIKIGSKEYRPSAAIFHHGNTLKSGHYITYIKNNNSWLCANDSIVMKKKWPNGAKDLFILLLSSTS